MEARGPRPRRKAVVPMTEITLEEKVARDLFIARHRKHGFAAWDAERRMEVSRKGGRASGGARRWTPEQRAENGRKGGKARKS
jgi:general stress protein YciG